MYASEGWYWHNTHEQLIEGRLWGGCLEVLYLYLSVRRYLPVFENLDGSILFLETSEEMPSEGLVYCFVSALAEIGLLQRFKAILMAYPKAQFCDRQPPEWREAFILNQQNAVKNALKDYKILNSIRRKGVIFQIIYCFMRKFRFFRKTIDPHVT